jgi:hypothetical protein
MSYYHYVIYNTNEDILEEFTIDYRLSARELEETLAYYKFMGIQATYDVIELINP